MARTLTVARSGAATVFVWLAPSWQHMEGLMLDVLDYQIIGWRAAVLRQRAGLDQNDAARQAGISLRTWRNMESGRRCRDATIFAVSRAFQCSPGWLIDMEELLRRIDQRKAVAS